MYRGPQPLLGSTNFRNHGVSRGIISRCVARAGIARTERQSKGRHTSRDPVATCESAIDGYSQIRAEREEFKYPCMLDGTDPLRANRPFRSRRALIELSVDFPNVSDVRLEAAKKQGRDHAAHPADKRPGVCPGRRLS